MSEVALHGDGPARPRTRRTSRTGSSTPTSRSPATTPASPCCASTSSIARWCGPRSRWSARDQRGAGEAERGPPRGVPWLRRAGATATRERRRPAIVITHGFTGSGKTTLSQELLEQRSARSASAPTSSASACMASRRPRAAMRRGERGSTLGRDAAHYDRALVSPRRADAGFVAIVDGDLSAALAARPFPRARRRLRDPVRRRRVCGDEATLRQRVAERARRGTDASDADLGVLEHQLRILQSLRADEMGDTVTYDAEAPLAAARSPRAWRAVLDLLGRLEAADAAGVT